MIYSNHPNRQITVDDIKKQDTNTYLFVKRAADLLLSIIGLTVLFVPMLIVAAAICIDSPGASPLFIQKRCGYHGKEFFMLKFRSMIPDADDMKDNLLQYNEMTGPVFKILEDPRITRLGRFLRKTCIDELPQLYNVIKGDMSLVGPRPPLQREVEQYTSRDLKRLSVKPGLTCYWQILPNRYDCTFDEWVDWDLKYINERSIATDCKIIFKTLGAIIRMTGF